MSIEDEHDLTVDDNLQGEESPIEQAAVMSEPVSTVPALHLTPDVLRMLLEAQSASTIEAIREMKRLSPEDQAKKDADAARSMAHTLRRVEFAQRQEAKYEQAWRNCAHQQPNGKTRFRGQVLSNGYSQAFCPECHYLSPPFQLTITEIQGGLNIDQWSGNVFGVIQQRVRNSPPPPPIPEIPPGGRIIF